MLDARLFVLVVFIKILLFKVSAMSGDNCNITPTFKKIAHIKILFKKIALLKILFQKNIQSNLFNKRTAKAVVRLRLAN